LIAERRHASGESYEGEKINHWHPSPDEEPLQMKAHILVLVSVLGYLGAMASTPLLASGQTSDANEWAWMAGSNLVGSTGFQATVYGTLGAPSPANTPGSRFGAVSWTDKNGHLWLFGGETTIAGGLIDEPNDLWEFDTSTNDWTWMGGGSANTCVVNECGNAGAYGTLGTPAAANFPGSRNGAVAWTDRNGHFWLFGGDGFDANGVVGLLNDMWEFDPSTSHWRWMGGNSIVPSANTGQPGVYGTMGVPAAGNNPGGRWMSAGSTDNKGNFWLFAGWGYDANGMNGSPNNLFEFSPSTNEWTWINGSSTVSTGGFQPGVYGSLGTPSPENIPGSRANALAWSDSGGNLWLFGGNGLDANGNSGYLNDMWQFNPSSNQWTWMGGSNVLNCAGVPHGYCFQQGVYGALGIAAAGNIPTSRENAAGWIDNDGNFWLFSGLSPYFGGNDLWEFHPSTNEWAWMGGSDSGEGSGVYGTLGIPAPGNFPPVRWGEAAWTDSTGSFWLYAGNWLAEDNLTGFPDDLWRYVPSDTVNVPHADFAFSLDTQSFTLLPARSAMSVVRVTGLDGFNSTITFSCSGLPTGATCSFFPSSITPAQSGVEYQSTMTVAVAASTASLHRSFSFMPLGTTLAALIFCFGWKKKRPWNLLALLVLSTTGLGVLTGCGGSAASQQPTTSIVTVTASSGSISHAITFSLTVDPYPNL
jgi:N-acetylneuraminic acid mutarotase